MPNTKRRNWLIFGACIFLVLAVLGVLSFFVPIYGEICGKDEYTYHKECAAYHIVPVALWHLAKALNDYGVALTAVATAAIAAFTFVLYRATNRQAELTRQSIDLGNREFASTHRPHLVIPSIALLPDWPTGGTEWLLSAFVRVVNQGSTEARDIQVHAHIARYAIPLRNGILLPLCEPALRPMTSSARDEIILRSEFGIDAEREVNRQWLQRPQSEALFCMGRINYADPSGGRRETGFCRILIFDPRAGGEPRWTEIDNPEYEYNY